MSTLTTTKYALRYPNLAQSPADVPAWLGNLAGDVDTVMVGYSQAVFASRPAAGKQGRIFYSTDTGVLYYDDGSAWQSVGASNRLGTLSGRPAFGAVPIGTKYFATDQVADYITDGTQWIRVSTPAGSVEVCLASTADTGYILLQGQSWPATTGIYADIYARLGSPGTVPDFGTFVPVGYKSGDGSFGTLLGTVGVKTVALATGELPASIPHTLTLPAHVHQNANGAGWHYVMTNGGGGNTPYAGGGTVMADNQENTGNPTTAPAINGSVGGSGTAHQNIQPSKAVNFQAKL